MPVVDGNIHTYIEGKSLVVAVALSNCLVLDRFVSFAVVNHHHHHHVVESKQCISKYHEFPHGALFYSVSLSDEIASVHNGHFASTVRGNGLWGDPGL